MKVSGEYNLLDISAFDAFTTRKEEFLSRSNDITERTRDIIETLLKNWAGEGADAFRQDSSNVMKNMNTLYDILKIMCETLEDCRSVFQQVDSKLGEQNRGGG